MTTAPVSPESVMGLLATVHDPEIPTVSIVDLGLVHDVRVDADLVTVELLPTFIACPALEVIRSAVSEALAPLGVTHIEMPTTSDRIWQAMHAAAA